MQQNIDFVPNLQVKVTVMTLWEHLVSHLDIVLNS